jgi:hypothetical protein
MQIDPSTTSSLGPWQRVGTIEVRKVTLPYQDSTSGCPTSVSRRSTSPPAESALTADQGERLDNVARRAKQLRDEFDALAELQPKE